MEVMLLILFNLLALSSGFKNTTIGKAGIISHDKNMEIFINRDSVLVTIVYDLSVIKTIWNGYITESESLVSKIGVNKCVNKVLTESITSRNLIRKFLSDHKTKNRAKRQMLMGIVTGIGSMVGLGITQYEINLVNSKIARMKEATDYEHGVLKTMNTAVAFNSKQIIYKSTQLRW